VLCVTAVPERVAHLVAERVVALIVDSLDVNALLGQVDVNALLDRIDVERLLRRVDLEALLARVDLASVLANSAETAAEDGARAVRDGATRADNAVARWAHRVIGRP
jgi:hypothetical protein